MHPSLTFLISLLIAFLSACERADPADEQIKGRLLALKPLMPIFFDQEFNSLSKEIQIVVGEYVEVTDVFGRYFQDFTKANDLSYAFDKENHLIDQRGNVVRIWIKVDQDRSCEVRLQTFDKSGRDLSVVFECDAK